MDIIKNKLVGDVYDIINEYTSNNLHINTGEWMDNKILVWAYKHTGIIKYIKNNIIIIEIRTCPLHNCNKHTNNTLHINTANVAVYPYNKKYYTTDYCKWFISKNMWSKIDVVCGTINILKLITINETLLSLFAHNFNNIPYEHKIYIVTLFNKCKLLYLLIDKHVDISLYIPSPSSIIYGYENVVAYASIFDIIKK